MTYVSIYILGIIIGYSICSWIRYYESLLNSRFVWFPCITRNHDGRRLYSFGFWKKFGK